MSFKVTHFFMIDVTFSIVFRSEVCVLCDIRKLIVLSFYVWHVSTHHLTQPNWKVQVVIHIYICNGIWIDNEICIGIGIRIRITNLIYIWFWILSRNWIGIGLRLWMGQGLRLELGLELEFFIGIGINWNWDWSWFWVWDSDWNGKWNNFHWIGP